MADNVQFQLLTASGTVSVLGLRIAYDGHYGTIKFYGEVPPASGLWYGVEWDEDGRGKHSGEHGGVKYFECSRAGAGSFIRAKKVDFGVSDVEALIEKFEDLYAEEEGKGLQFFYHVGRNDEQGVEEKLKRLKHVNLRWTNVARSANEESLGSIAPNIVELDLSKTLLSDWEEVLKIIKNLPRLSKLDVSENRLRVPAEQSKKSGNVLNQFPLKTLVANKMNLGWMQILAMASTFSDLEELHASYNDIQSLKEGDINDVKKLQKLDLEGNNLSNWNDILLLQELPVLEVLALSDTKLDGIVFPGNIDQTTDVFMNLKCLLLSKTMFSSWLGINQLNRLPALEMLSLQACPLVHGMSKYDARQEIIARIAKCSHLNNSDVTVKERQASERAYLKQHGKEWLASGGSLDNMHSKVDNDFMVKHPRYLLLLEKQGVPEGVDLLVNSGSTLKDNLVAVTITCVDDKERQSVTKKLPRSMPISKLKGLLQRLFKVQPVKQILSYVDQAGHEVEMDDELRPLSFYSLESGDTINLRW